jgi:hypothetical protein
VRACRILSITTVHLVRVSYKYKKQVIIRCS